jgi:hypothetical protein
VDSDVVLYRNSHFSILATELTELTDWTKPTCIFLPGCLSFSLASSISKAFLHFFPGWVASCSNESLTTFISAKPKKAALGVAVSQFWAGCQAGCKVRSSRFFFELAHMLLCATLLLHQPASQPGTTLEWILGCLLLSIHSFIHSFIHSRSSNFCTVPLSKTVLRVAFGWTSRSTIAAPCPLKPSCFDPHSVALGSFMDHISPSSSQLLRGRLWPTSSVEASHGDSQAYFWRISLTTTARYPQDCPTRDPGSLEDTTLLL